MMAVNYDFIVIGGGSSGSALASILASKGLTLLIERGANHTAYPQSIVRQGSPQIAAIALERIRNNGSGHWTGTANILGGGSALNGGTCWRGERSIFESLGFDLKAVEDVFGYLEDTVCTSNDDADTEYMQAFRDAWADHGYEQITSSSGSGSWIKSSAANTIQRARSILPVSGRRRPASYLFESVDVTPQDKPSILDQGNLTVFLLTKAKRIMFNDGNVAVGVDIISPAGHASIYVRNGGKIFLNAGAYETPKLLMLSGIGPTDTLSEHGIPIVYQNNAVGQNLIDRKELSVVLPKPKLLEGDDVGCLDYAAINKDYWASVYHKNAGGWGNAVFGCGACKMESRTSRCADQLLGALILYGSGTDSDAAPYFIAQRRPFTRGNVTLASSNFEDQPLVHDGWTMTYEDLSKDAKHDLEVMVDAVQDLIIDLLHNATLLESLGQPAGSTKGGSFSNETIKSLMSTRAMFYAANESLDQCTFSDLFVGDDTFCTNWDKCVPSVPSLPYNDRSKLRDVVFGLLSSSQHISGTCKVGDVVDKRTLSVIGVEGLYISDLSVLAQPADIHPMMTAMSIGLLLGRSIDDIHTTDYESTPPILAMICIAGVAFLLVGWMVVLAYEKRSNSQEFGTHDNREASIFDVWGIKDERVHNDVISEPSDDHKTIPTKVDCLIKGADEEEGFKAFLRFIQPGNNDNTAATKENNVGIVDNATEVNDVSFVKEELRTKNKNGFDDDAEIMNESTFPLGVSNANTPKLLMSWSDVSCTYDPAPRKSKKPPITTLFDNSGCMREGEVTAIMGPSGASKSTLLDILAGRKSIGRISGAFSVLGRSFNVSEEEKGLDTLSKAIMGVSAYIPQQEYFYPTQTCEEAIKFTADMKFGRDHQGERARVVRACLNVVGLDAETFASRKIGGELAGGVMIRGLSGGERKRLAMACALALKPKMLFIDELTSGLDSENAFLIMKLLKDISANMQVATLIIIHQPSPDVFTLFDRLILLSKGRFLFSDSCSNLSAFYGSNYDENVPSDAVIANDLVAKASRFDLSNEDAGVNYYKGDMDQSYYHSINCIYSTDHERDGGLIFKLAVLFRRNLINQYIRNIPNVAARLGSYSGLALIIGTVFWQVGSTASERGLNYVEANLVLRSNLFLMNVSYLLPFSTIPVFFADKKFLAAESALGLYPAWMYGMSQVFLEFLFLIVTSTVEAAIVIPMCGLVNPTIPYAVNFLTITSILIVSGLVGSTMVFCSSIWLPTQDLAFITGSTVVTVGLALSGGFLPFTAMPDIPRTLQWISPIKYSFQAMAMAQFRGTTAEKVIDIAGYNTPASIAENIWILYGIFGVLSLLTVFGMARVKEGR